MRDSGVVPRQVKYGQATILYTGPSGTTLSSSNQYWSLLSIVGTLATGISLQRGVTQINEGLSRLEKDFKFRLPARSDELGRVSQSINRMAAVRGHLETELRREDRLRAVGHLASSLAHEIRNPLNSIRLTVQLLEQRLKTNSIRPQDLAIVKGEVDRLNTLVTDLLDLQRTRQPRPEWQPILPVVEHCMQLLHKQAEAQGHSFELQAHQPDLRACTGRGPAGETAARCRHA
jgi:signal transduction histidine kinase